MQENPDLNVEVRRERAEVDVNHALEPKEEVVDRERTAHGRKEKDADAADVERAEAQNVKAERVPHVKAERVQHVKADVEDAQEVLKEHPQERVVAEENPVENPDVEEAKNKV